MTQRFTLSGSERIKSRKLIEQLFREGKSFNSFPLKILYLLQQNGVNTLQAGFAVSAKNFKRAVDRNRIKRLIKECYRLQKKSLAEKLGHKKKFMAVFFIYTGRVLPEYKVISEKIYIGLTRLEKIADESIASNS